MNLLNKLTRQGKPAGGNTAALHASGEDGLVPEKVIAKVRAQSRLDTLADVTVDRARWFVAFLMLGGITLFASAGWWAADSRFANNVRVAWVKLDPSGAYTVEFADQNRPVEFFQATLESKLTELVEKRYRRSVSTVTADYRFVSHFLSPQLATRFVGSDDFNAARVAAELSSCKGNCLERDVRVRVVQHRTSFPLRMPDAPTMTVNESLIFVTFTDRKLDGEVVERRNAIVQLNWRLKSKPEIVGNKSNLLVNPLGIEVLTMDLKEDPTPLPKDEKSNALS